MRRHRASARSAALHCFLRQKKAKRSYVLRKARHGSSRVDQLARRTRTLAGTTAVEGLLAGAEAIPGTRTRQTTVAPLPYAYTMLVSPMPSRDV